MKRFAKLRRALLSLLVLTALAAAALFASKEMGFDLGSEFDLDELAKFDSARAGAILARFTGHEAHESAAHDDHDDDDDDKDDDADDDDDDDDHHSDADHDAGGEEGEGGHGHHESHKIVVTAPKVMDVDIIQPYVSQIHSRRHIEVCALEKGYLQEVLVKEGQAVKKGDPMFKILPTLYQAKLDAEVAEAKLAELEYANTKNLADRNVVSQNEVLLLEAKMAKAKANAELARAELNFTNIVAPFDGIVDRLHKQLGSLIAEGDVLTTLSDNSVMWVYFNVPESAYLEYMEEIKKPGEEERVELVLANGKKFTQIGTIGAIEAKFNNQTGNIPFRADFPNPDGLLRHGQTGTILLTQVRKDALVIPQRATFELLDKRYVFVVDDKNVTHQRLITIETEKDDIFVIESGLAATDRIVLDGVREVRDGGTIKFETIKPDQVLANLKYHAE